MSKWDGMKRLFWQPGEEIDDEEAGGAPQEIPTAIESRPATQSALQPGSTSLPHGSDDHTVVGPEPNKAGLGRTLSTLRDVDGILGSIVVGASGNVIGRDLPAVFSEDVVEQLAGRLNQLHEALVLDGGELASADLHFAEFRLHLGKLSDGLLGVLAQQHTNGPALGMAVNLVARRVQKQLMMSGA